MINLLPIIAMVCVAVGIHSIVTCVRSGNRWPFIAALLASLMIIVPIVVAFVVGKETWNSWFMSQPMESAGLLWALTIMPLAIIAVIVFTVIGVWRQRRHKVT